MSDDRDQQAMDTYLSETKMPWAGIKLGNTTIAMLSRKFGVSGKLKVRPRVT